ncbi:MAG: CaiB/BaiF CoA-transferase family protein [Pseudomonadales bacterium]
MNLPFAGLRVVDAASFLAGPGAGTVLGDFGADVIKIEPPGGDGYRQLHGGYQVDYNWQLTSRNKRSLALDLTQPAGQQILLELIDRADVLLVNLFPRQLARYGLEYEALRARNPRLIYAHMSGYGTEGPDGERRAFDTTAWWARSGMMDMVREAGQPPVVGAPGFGDHSSAMSLFGAVAMALYQRERTGEGSRVATSLLANGVWANGMQVQGAIAGFDLAERRQRKGWLNPFTSVYPSADGRYVIFAMTNAMREWPGVCDALGHREWLDDPRFADFVSIMRHRRELIALISESTRALTLSELCARLDRADLTYGVVTHLAEVIDDPQLLANGILVDTGSADPLYPRTVANPIRLDGVDPRCAGPAPALGEHSRAVLAELGLSAREIEELVRSGVVVAGPSGPEQGAGDAD